MQFLHATRIVSNETTFRWLTTTHLSADSPGMSGRIDLDQISSFLTGTILDYKPVNVSTYSSWRRLPTKKPRQDWRGFLSALR
ncbi:hypothetical protein [Marichromatium sp. AB32]|uniref:hypothetical protein n=1 Tax=Marichromatium sp. AB32 TaxID=2483363 RepID=UPI0016806E09|nr:hypothetical protein [Marichromatium sp. AB32]